MGPFVILSGLRAKLASAPGSAIVVSFTSLISFNFRNVNAVGAPNVQFNELRVGDTWADVTPVLEAGALVLLLVGLGMLSRRERTTRA